MFKRKFRWYLLCTDGKTGTEHYKHANIISREWMSVKEKVPNRIAKQVNSENVGLNQTSNINLRRNSREFFNWKILDRTDRTKRLMESKKMRKRETVKTQQSYRFWWAILWVKFVFWLLLHMKSVSKESKEKIGSKIWTRRNDDA